ncbi:MAG TPA: hypothetical protein DHW25_04785 [Blautia sp.]|nr:hypothetical protein [Blautia sp.]
MKNVFRTWFLGITTIFALLTFGAATYAWFTSNRAVSTSTATARTGEETLELQLSSQGGSSFQSVETAAITQVNQTTATQLMPVSTVNLSDFVYSPATVDGMASAFLQVENEQYYYHGRLYIRAQGTGWSDGTTVNLYLDQSDGLLGEASSGALLTASRLGLVFDGATSSAVILRLTEDESSQSQQVYNTVINGQTLGSNQVLQYQNGTVSAATDPSQPIADYTVSFTSDSISLPSRPLLTMNLNQIYTLDIYFYLEGCDPDCSDGISQDMADIHLAFFGALNQGEV